MKPAHGYTVCPVCKHRNVHATSDGKIAQHYGAIAASRPCQGSGQTAENRHLKPIAPKRTDKDESMKTESTSRQSSVAAFLGEAAGPEATVTTTITGSQRAVQKAIAGLAKRPSKKAPAAPGEPEVEIEVEPEFPKADLGGDEEAGDKGNLPPPPKRKPKLESAQDIVEALIRE